MSDTRKFAFGSDFCVVIFLLAVSSILSSNAFLKSLRLRPTSYAFVYEPSSSLFSTPAIIFSFNSSNFSKGVSSARRHHLNAILLLRGIILRAFERSIREPKRVASFVVLRYNLTASLVKLASVLFRIFARFRHEKTSISAKRHAAGSVAVALSNSS